ncbi:MAG TPA: flagellar hook-basal body complex protein FliE [Acidimicrobiales bacterium]|nr:flagellar hook-basal body complex protein FliE [Acidimicrobiales bacterium]
MTVAAVGAVAATQMTPATAPAASSATQNPTGTSFASLLDSAQQSGVTADKLAGQVATGDLPNIQQFTSAAAKAELTVDLVVAVRNRAIDAYQEIMRMSV